MLLNRIVAFCMLLMFMAQSFSSLFIVADYYINTSNFVDHCINKDKPAMHCNGQCQLSKKVDAENNKDQTNPERKSDSKMEVLSAKNFFSNIQFFSTPLSPPKYQQADSGNPVKHASNIFHPPCA